VVAGLIWKGDKFLIWQRPANKARGMLWELVGGKVEKGETKEQALIRECEEELAITVEPHGIFTEVTHEYPDISIRLTLFNCAISSGEPKLLEHNAIEWITSAEIGKYEFCPADKEILKKIKELENERNRVKAQADN
nr:(deoxy)nucleoside triphosphate pyrophosphohydrolase [Clostridia bacterium]